MGAVKITIPAPTQPCVVRGQDGNIYGVANNFAEFQSIVTKWAPGKCDLVVKSEGAYVASDPETDRTMFLCKFDDYATEATVIGEVPHKSKYKVIDCRTGFTVGMCDDYDGFITCVKAVSGDRDVSFSHTPDMDLFVCTSASDRLLYMPALNN